MPKSASDLIQIMRNVTGRVDASDPLFTDTIMRQYLNDFVVQLSSHDVRIFKNKTWLEFDISPSTPNPYPVDLQGLKLTTIGPIAYVQLSQQSDPTVVTDTPMVGTIDSANQVFTLSATPFVLPGTVFITGTNPAQSLMDDGVGGFTGDGSGSINYNTGAISIVFDAAPIAASTVTITYSYNTGSIVSSQTPSYSFNLFWYQDPGDFFRKWPDIPNYTPQRPSDVLYYNNQLLFRGPPDQEYHIKIEAYQEEIEFTDEGSLNADYMFRYLAYGASLDIFSDYGEMDRWRETFPVFQRYRALVYSRTYCQYQNQRPSPEF